MRVFVLGVARKDDRGPQFVWVDKGFKPCFTKNCAAVLESLDIGMEKRAQGQEE